MIQAHAMMTHFGAGAGQAIEVKHCAHAGRARAKRSPQTLT
jgi:hypothetical protein